MTDKNWPIPTLEQIEASNPSLSCWVFASAGSGKTSVLKDRVLRLLLADPDPSGFLCLTFTKAAAAEMTARISNELAEWALMQDGDLQQRLLYLIGAKPHDDQIERARTLFAKVLDEPRGLPIFTIHAFCQSLLRRFPAEAGLMPHFDPMDEKDAKALREDVWQEVLEDVARDAEFFPILAELDEARLKEIIEKIGSSRDAFLQLRRLSPDRKSLLREYARLLGLSVSDTEESVVRSACRNDAFSELTLRGAVAALRAGGQKDALKRAGSIENWLALAEEERPQYWDDYCAVFLTGDGEIRKKLSDKPSRGVMVDIEECLQEEAARILSVKEKIQVIGVRDLSAAMARFALDVEHRYQRRKRELAKLDYDDLIERTRMLLRQPGIAPWVLYKLDGKLRHILIDESQDTNQAQWDIVTALTEEFFSGAGRDPDRRRSIFAVGDVKQSIYRFQGAEPGAFLKANRYFSEKITEPDLFTRVEMTQSFRSAPLILTFVDRIFAGKGELLAGERLEIQHKAAKVTPGRIHCWPYAGTLEKNKDKAVATKGEVGQEEEGEDSHDRPADEILAERIADEIRDLIDQDHPAGDIVVLFRSRSRIVNFLVRALKRRQVPVMGQDRLKLLDEIVVLDLIAFAQFVLLPNDDFNLACLLKSPLFGFTDDDLLVLAPERKERSLLAVLASRSEEKYRSAYRGLQGYLADADYVPPFELFSRILSRDGGRHKFYARLGSGCGDAIDAFLSLALKYETQRAVSLQGFLQWFHRGDNVVKRENEAEAVNDVRLMTIHGAKGLEAKTVFILDSKRSGHAETIFWYAPELGKNTREGSTYYALPLYVRGMQVTHPVIDKLRDAEKEKVEAEEQRLLYVALTRAKETLYLCSWIKKSQTSEWANQWRAICESWGSNIEELAGFPSDLWSGKGYKIVDGVKSQKGKREPKKSVGARGSLPSWIAQAKSEPVARVIAPSRLTEGTRLALAQTDFFALERGQIIHRILEWLPNVPQENRVPKMTAFLKRNDIPETLSDEIIAEVMRQIEAEDCRILFGAESVAEVPVSGKIVLPSGEAVFVSGRIDRLVIGEKDISILDYKTNRKIPADKDAIPLPYVRQMALYCELLKVLYPTRKVRAFLLWTVGPIITPIPDEKMKEALRTLPAS